MQPVMGAVVAGKYVLTRQLGKGGMGAVWQADDLQLQRSVAIKFMTGDWASSNTAKVRFEREAHAASQTKHPYIIDIKGYGIDGDTPFIVMELLEGEDLYARFRRTGRMPLITAAKLLNQIAAGLNEAHRHGVIHRDLKPGNIVMAKIGGVEIPKIVDFGLAKAKHTGFDGDTTGPGTILGSLNYISPEQLESSKDVDHRSDLWSLGVIMFRLITGELPFKGEEPRELAKNIRFAPIPSPSTVAPNLGLPIGLDAFFRRALSRDTTQRFQTALEMSEQFTRIVQGLPEIPRDSTEPLNEEYDPRPKHIAVAAAEAALKLSTAPRRSGQAAAANEEMTPIEISEGQMLQVVYHGSAPTAETSPRNASAGDAALTPKVKVEEISTSRGKISAEPTELDSEELLSTHLKVDVELSSTFVKAEARRKEGSIGLPDLTDPPGIGGSPRKGRRPLMLLVFSVVIVAALAIGMVGAWSYQAHQGGAKSPGESTSESLPDVPPRSATPAH